MKTNNVFKRTLGGLWILSIAFIMSCGPTRDGQAGRDREPGTTEETVEALDTRIRDLNQELSSVERDLRADGREVEGEMDEAWSNIEDRRQDLNRNIERYNNAIQRDAELEAAQIRSDIDRQLSELEAELQTFRNNFRGGDKDNRTIPN